MPTILLEVKARSPQPFFATYLLMFDAKFGMPTTTWDIPVVQLCFASCDESEQVTRSCVTLDGGSALSVLNVNLHVHFLPLLLLTVPRCSTIPSVRT